MADANAGALTTGHFARSFAQLDVIERVEVPQVPDGGAELRLPGLLLQDRDDLVSVTVLGGSDDLAGLRFFQHEPNVVFDFVAAHRVVATRLPQHRSADYD